MWHSVPRLKKCQQKQSNFSIGARGFINTPSSRHWRSLIAMVLFHDGGSRRPGVGSNAPSLGNTKHHKDVAASWSIHMTQYQIFASVSQHSMSENHGILHRTCRTIRRTEEQEKKQNIASSSVWNLIMGRCVRVQINVFGTSIEKSRLFSVACKPVAIGESPTPTSSTRAYLWKRTEYA